MTKPLPRMLWPLLMLLALRPAAAEPPLNVLFIAIDIGLSK